MMNLILWSIAVFLVANVSAQEEMAMDPALVEEINSNRAISWTAGINDRFKGLTLDEAKILMGTFLPDHPDYRPLPRLNATYSVDRSSIPDNFDSREQWAKCGATIGHIRDQSSCGSCWSFAVAEAFTDRHCINANGDSTMYSALDLLSCCNFENSCFGCQGCNGGFPGTAWQYTVSAGITTGGDYQDTTTCKPYPWPLCSHHMDTPVHEDCAKHNYETPGCTSTCANGENYNDRKMRARRAFSVDGSVADIQREIMTNGPVSAGFTVYKDFLHYKCGVYSHVSGERLGGHAVKIIGWGVENGVQYWLVINSWNDTWGDKGTFKIARGNNECGFESMIDAATF